MQDCIVQRVAEGSIRRKEGDGPAMRGLGWVASASSASASSAAAVRGGQLGWVMGPWGDGRDRRREIDGGVDGPVEWQLCVFQGRTQKVHLISSPPPRRVMRLQNTRVAEHQPKQQVAREGPPLDTAGWNTKPPFQQFKSLLRDRCNAASDWHGTGRPRQTRQDISCNVNIFSLCPVRPPLHSSCLGAWTPPPSCNLT